MIFNDMDQWREALAKCHLNESSMPTSRGYLVENVECYNKIQQILDTPEMEHCHKFLYNLDVEDLQEVEVEKVNKLYELGKERGFIKVEDDEETTDECDICGDDACTDPANHTTTPMPPVVPPAIPAPAIKTCAYTVMYSAMKDGEIKTGEAYSNSISPRSAKADVLAKLMQLGYDNVTILAIEASDPDCVGSDMPEEKPASFVPPAKEIPEISSFESEDDEECDEDDMLDGRKHNLHIDEKDDKEADDEEVEDKADDKKEDKKDDAADDEEVDNDKDDKDAAADDKDTEEDAGDEDADDSTDDEDTEKDSDKDDADGDDKEELDATKKNQYKDQYNKAFKAAMLKCKFEKSFNDLSLEEKVKLFTELNKTWKDKPDPSEFMTPKETDALNKTVMKR